VFSRLTIGVTGLAVIVISVAWPQVVRPPENTVMNAIGGPLMYLGTLIGVYLLFYSMTGDWLPKLTSRKRKNR